MTRKLIITIFISLLALFPYKAYSTEFDELDKPPEGAHKGQMLLGFFVSIGVPGGDLIDAENDFLENSSYTFENDIIKALEVSHLSFSLGLSYEYMPFDHFGAAARLRRTNIIQRTNFGANYENWKGFLYRDYSIYIGPSVHATTRKRWDFILTPLIGYCFAKYAATPVADKIISYDAGVLYTGEKRKSSQGLSYGAELNCTIYFSGGLYISIGGEWIRNSLKFDSAFDLTNPQTNGKYYSSTSGNIDSLNAVIAAGYTFSN